MTDSRGNEWDFIEEDPNYYAFTNNPKPFDVSEVEQLMRAELKEAKEAGLDVDDTVKLNYVGWCSAVADMYGYEYCTVWQREVNDNELTTK